MYDTPRTIDEIRAMLAAAPAIIAGLTQGLQPAQLLIPPEPDEWSLRDVLAHPRAWSRAALVTGAGKPRERIVHTYALWLANHEKSHFRQMEQTVNAVSALAIR